MGTFDRELMRLLNAAGCYHGRDGRLPMYYSPITNRTFPVPAGIKSLHTADVVQNQAGLPKAS